MLRALKAWLTGRASTGVAGWADVQAWCARRELAYEPAAAGPGFAVRGRVGATAWRLAWGSPQRLYVRGRGELVLQSEMNLAPELHLMLLDRGLHRQLERAVLDQIQGAADGLVDARMPAEMRWVATFPRLDPAQAGLPAGLDAVASHPEWLLAWTGAALGQALRRAPVPGHSPWVLTVGAGQLNLRAALDDPHPAQLEAWIGLFECAMREARRAQVEMGDKGEPTTLPSLWAVGRDDVADGERP